MKYSIMGLMVIAGALALTAPALAQESPLSVACSVAVSNNDATWSVSASGGVPPYTFLWSGDPSVNGSTSTTINTTYSANGTYVGTVEATDASSTTATTTCQAVINSFTTSTSTPTGTTHTQVNVQPTLSINGSGRFTADDMVVQSLGSGSLTASVWGVTYTVVPPSSFSLSNVSVNDQLSVTGTVSSTTPLTVNASSIRDLSLVLRPSRGRQPWSYHFNNSGSANGSPNSGTSSYSGQGGYGGGSNGSGNANNGGFFGRWDRFFNVFSHIRF